METTITLHTSDLPSMNVLLRLHWAKRKKLLTDLIWKVKEQTRNRHAGQVEITYHRFAVRQMDWDNFSGSFKCIGDALVDCKVIIDDKPKVVVDFIPLQTKVSKLADEKIIITIKDKH